MTQVEAAAVTLRARSKFGRQKENAHPELVQRGAKFSSFRVRRSLTPPAPLLGARPIPLNLTTPYPRPGLAGAGHRCGGLRIILFRCSIQQSLVIANHWSQGRKLGSRHIHLVLSAGQNSEGKKG